MTREHAKRARGATSRGGAAGRLKQGCTVVVATLLVGFALNVAVLALELPRHWGQLAEWTRAGGVLGPNRLAFEALIAVGLVGLLAALRWRRAAALMTGLGVLALLVLALIAAFDGLARAVLARGLNLALDVPLLASVWHLARDNLGVLPALVVFALVLVGVMALGALCYGVLRAWWRRVAALAGAARGVMAVASAGVLVFGGYGLYQIQFGAPWFGLERIPRAVAPAIHLVREQNARFYATRAEAAAFGRALEHAEARAVVPLEGLRGRGLDLIFVESYGNSLLGDPRWSADFTALLGDWQARLEAQGFHMASTTVEAVTMGGQSWLNHATTLLGQPVHNQLRYELMQRSQAATWLDDARAAGLTTAAIMPAITMPWPEGRWFAYDHIVEAGDLGYAGPPFHWVTMPDQYTLAVHERLRTAWGAESPDGVMIVTALISSHAPWTPILPRIDWAEVGDGAVFWRFDGFDDPPEVLWRDLDRVREYYGRSVAYALDVTFSWIDEKVRDDRLIVVLGDHPAAPMIVGHDVGRGVPLHVVSRDPALIACVLETPHFVPGLWPETVDPARPGVWPMADLRRWARDLLAETVDDDRRPADGGGGDVRDPMASSAP